MQELLAILALGAIAVGIYVAFRLKKAQDVTQRIDEKAAHVTEIVNQGTRLLQSARPLLNGWNDKLARAACDRYGVC